MIKVGREEPAISMDVNGGKIIWAKHSEMQQVNLKALPEGKLEFARGNVITSLWNHVFIKWQLYRYRNKRW